MFTGGMLQKFHCLVKMPPVISPNNNMKHLSIAYIKRTVFLSMMFTLVFMLNSCDNTDKNIIPEYVFHKDISVSQTKMDSLARLNLTILDTAQHVILPGNACCMSVADGSYFVYAKASVYRFNEKGECQAVIGRLGHGKGEYPEARDIAIDEKERKVVVLSEQSVYVYDYEGKYVSKHSINIPANSICKTDNHYWFSTGNNTSNSANTLFRTNLEYGDMKGFAPAESEVNMVEKNFGKGAMTTYHNWFSHTVYRVDDEKVSVAFCLSFPMLEFPQCTNKDMDFWERDKILSASNYISIAQCLENNHYLYLLLAENIPSKQSMQVYHWIINKRTDNSMVVKINQESMESYHVNPQYLSEDNVLFFIGYPEAHVSETSAFRNNPSIVRINLTDLI